MEDRLLSMIAGFGIAGALLAHGIVRARRVRLELEGLDEALRGYAETRGLTFHPASAETSLDPDAAYVLASLTGDAHGVLIDVAVVRDEGRMVTRVEAPMPGVTAGFVVSIHRRSLLRPLRARLQSVESTRTGNKVFDAAFLLLSNDADKARSIVDRRLAQLVGNFPRRGARVEVREGRLSLSWDGAERDGAVLDAAMQVVWTGCRRRA
jgi:hypothetical protein